MLRTATREDLDAIREVLIRANDSPYDISLVVEEKCHGRGFEGDAQARLFVDGDRVRGVVVTCGRYVRLLAVDRQWRRRGIGSDLLRDAHASGATRIAAEPGNYFTPGVWDGDTTMIAFLVHHGYTESGSTRNLETEALPDGPPPGVRENDKQRTLDFIEREFGSVWRFECERAGALFHVEDDGEIAGFSAAEANNHGLGCFGPTGVARAKRGHGLGTLLLNAALAELRRRGYARAVIPWTDATEFYMRSCGARIAHRFIQFVKA